MRRKGEIRNVFTPKRRRPEERRREKGQTNRGKPRVSDRSQIRSKKKKKDEEKREMQLQALGRQLKKKPMHSSSAPVNFF